MNSKIKRQLGLIGYKNTIKKRIPIKLNKSIYGASNGPMERDGYKFFTPSSPYGGLEILM